MRADLRLYIGDKEVELTANPAILYSYCVDDLTNPTAVKNSFSKTITIQGTPNNNKIFGEYWNVERRVGSGGQNSGVDFNASKKAPFQVFVNSELYESGYVKLEKVNVINDVITYDISLYGGLGDFFYSLSYNSNTGEKSKLSDLDYGYDLGFTASATTVYEAWDDLKNGRDTKWNNTINFCPAYNGYPADFDADKVIIGVKGTNLKTTVIDDGKIYTPKNGFVIADLPTEMTEWEMRDLRSYLQRPCIRMKSIIDACCSPEQNGGYEVDLDPDFFNDDNAYYSKTWMTLPLLKNLEYTNQEQVLEGAELIGLTTTGTTDGLMYQDLKFDIGEFGSTTPSDIQVSANVFINNPLSGIAEEIDPFFEPLTHILAPYTSFILFARPHGNKIYNNWDRRGSLFVQLIALNGDVVVGASDAYNLTSPVRHNGRVYIGDNSVYPPEYQFKPYLDKNITNILGEFHDDGFHRDGQASAAVLDFTIRNCNSPVSQLKMVYFFGATTAKVKKYGRSVLFGETYEDAFFDFDWFDWSPDVTMEFKDPYEITVGVRDTDIQAVLGESMGRTGTKVSQAELLNTDGSPADYLLSYCKMFGLYFRKEIDNNVIHIETRKTFYNRGEVVDLNDFIDRGKDTKINPLMFSTKWYEMVQEMDESDFYEKYKSARGVEYGCKMLNTGYEFSVEKKNLYEGNAIRSGIEGLERSKFFSAFNDDNRQRSWMGMGLHYNLYQGDETYGVDVPIRNNSDLFGINEGEGMKYYDILPKLQFHKSENDPTDGNNVLVFFSGFKSVTSGRSNPITYYLTDDNAWQTMLNDSTPCWLFTTSDYVGDKRIAYTLNELPVFERYLTDENSGKVKKSLDFGTPQELYIPDYNIEEQSNIYTNFWRTYIEDLFDPDTKGLTCYVVVKGKIGSDWLRRFYWFDNAIWRLNRVNDWDIASYGSTQMEFIKVQDMANYTTITQTQNTKISLIPDSYTVDSSGGTITFTVSVSNGGNWRISAPSGLVLSRTNGTGDGTFTCTFPANTTDDILQFFFTASTDDNAQARVSIGQYYDGMTDFTPVPEDIIIPASGGTVFVDFIWKNQGDDYVASIDLDESDSALPFSCDLITYMGNNRAALTFSANTTGEPLHNYCQFRNVDGDIRHSVGLDQLPAEYDFEISGGTASMRIQYSSNASFSTPYWVSIEEEVEGDHSIYTITALSNLYDSTKDDEVVMTNTDGISAAFRVKQGAGGGVMPSNPVSPLNLYYDATGGTQYINVGLTHPWSASSSTGSFWTLTSQNGDGAGIIGVVVGENIGSALQGTITITDLVAGANYIVTVTQDGASTTRTLTVTPTSVNVPQSGGSYTLDVNYQGRNGDYVSVVGSGLTWTPISWSGESGSTVVTVPANDSPSSTTYTLTFSAQAGTAVVTFSQASTTEAGSVDRDSVTFDYDGGTDNNGVSANTPWTASTSVGWLSVTPTSGDSGYTNIVISASTNTDLSGRTGYVYIDSIATGSRLAEIEVYQEGMRETLSVSPSTIYFDSQGGTATFTITSNTNWTIDGNS